MNMSENIEDRISYTAEEIEETRLEEIERLEENLNIPLKEVKKRYNNEIGIHEALHAAWMHSEMVSNFLVEHPAVVMDPVAFRYAYDAQTALFNLYQRLGRLQHDVVTRHGPIFTGSPADETE